VYYDSTKNGSEFFLALDDGGGDADDNHDDYIVKVTVAAIPPACQRAFKSGPG
jgi:hypothetical protein